MGLGNVGTSLFYSLNKNDETQQAKYNLEQKYKEFFKYNPQFGRKVLKRIPNNLFGDKDKKVKYKREFQTKYLQFCEIKIETEDDTDSDTDDDDEIFADRNNATEQLFSLQSDFSMSSLEESEDDENNREESEDDENNREESDGAMDISSESNDEDQFIASLLMNEFSNLTNEENS